MYRSADGLQVGLTILSGFGTLVHRVKLDGGGHNTQTEPEPAL